MDRRPPVHEAAEELAARIHAEFERLRPLLSDVDPGDLLLIIESVMKPVGSGRVFFLREARPGVYVPW